jgi:hypothetical protein
LFVAYEDITKSTILFPQATRSFPLSDDAEFPDYAEVWVEANRSRARILTRYFSTLGAALLKRWEAHRGSAADRATPIQVPARPDMAIAERAVRSGGK